MAGTVTTLDVRADFPMLQRLIDERPIVYLDSAATSQKPAVVLEAMDDLYRSHNASIHRGVYTLGREATDAFEGARARIAAFVGVGDAVDDLHRQRDRGHQPRRVLLGTAQPRAG